MKFSKTFYFILSAIILLSAPAFAESQTSETTTKTPTILKWQNTIKEPAAPLSKHTATITLTDISGNPLANKMITWSPKSVSLLNGTTMTDENGVSTNTIFVTHTDRNITYYAYITADFAGDDTYSPSTSSYTLMCFDTSSSIPPSQTPAPPTPTTPEITQSTPPVTPTIPSRPPTPSVKRTPGPTEVDCIYTYSGYITLDTTPEISKDSDLLSGFSVTIAGTNYKITTKSDGHFSFSCNYTSGLIHISKPGFITREIQLESLLYKSSSKIFMFNGDLNNDNAINMADIMIVAKSFNTLKGNAGFNELYDLSKDNVINIADIMIIAYNFNKSSDDYKKLVPNYLDTTRKLDLTVEEAKQITKNSADIKGGIYLIEGYSCWTPVWIEYWEANNPSNVTLTTSDFIFYYPDYIARTLTELNPGTTYMYRVNSGIGTSETKSFTTLSSDS